MKTNKNISEDTLFEVFNKIPLDEPELSFMENLLQRIEKEAIIVEKKKQLWINVGQVAAGFLGVIIFPILTIYLCTIYLPDFSFSFPKIHISLNHNLITIGFSILLLLILDSLFRMYSTKRTNNNS